MSPDSTAFLISSKSLFIYLCHFIQEAVGFLFNYEQIPAGSYLVQISS